MNNDYYLDCKNRQILQEVYVYRRIKFLASIDFIRLRARSLQSCDMTRNLSSLENFNQRSISSSSTLYNLLFFIDEQRVKKKKSRLSSFFNRTYVSFTELFDYIKFVLINEKLFPFMEMQIMTTTRLYRIVANYLLCDVTFSLSLWKQFQLNYIGKRESLELRRRCKLFQARKFRDQRSVSSSRET